MVAAQKVDVVIVTSPDYTHAENVDRALRARADVVVEKPLTTDAVRVPQDHQGDRRNRPGRGDDLQLPVRAAQPHPAAESSPPAPSAR